MNACKLLDLALILPADSLPQFQLHRWAFLGDSTSPTSFDITTIFSALSKADNALPLDTISIFSFDDRASSNDIQMQMLSNEVASSTTSTTAGGGGDTTSLHSNSISDSASQFGPQSLPATLSSSSSINTNTNGSGRSATMKNYIPHIVIINSILNYLTVSLLNWSNVSRKLNRNVFLL